MIDRVPAPADAASPEGEPTVLIADGPDALARTAADLLVARIAEAIGLRGEAHVALTGGSSARALYEQLRRPPRRAAVAWERVHAWLGDDRFVPLDDPESNAGLALRELVAEGSGPLPEANLHPIPIEAAIAAGGGPADAAAAWVEQLRTWVPFRGGAPAFDVLLLGVGGDGHVLSAFPGSAALVADAPVALAIPAPTHIAPHLPRVTLGVQVLATAGRVLLIVGGSAKAEVLGRIFGPQREPGRWPAQLALRENATWLLDRASAAGLLRDRGRPVRRWRRPPGPRPAPGP